MKKKMVIEIGVIIAIVMFIAIIFWAVRDRFWWRVYNVRVTCGEEELKNFNVYKHRNGDLLIIWRDGEKIGGLYIIKMKSGHVELPNSNQFYQFSSCLLTDNVPFEGVSMNSSKSDVAPSLEVKSNEVSFTALSGERVNLYFNL
ncbi:MAG: hypothetical protein D6735_10925 [Acidobacteria bacterium]|nr:MAG: hypothetical protein D6735_10925 [Acidobacteriota bacterium]